MSRRSIPMVLLLASLALVATGCIHHGGSLRHDKGQSKCGQTRQCGPCSPCAKASPCGGPCGAARQQGMPGAEGAFKAPCGYQGATPPCGGPKGAASASADTQRFFMCDSEKPCTTISDKPGNCSCGKPMREMNMPPQMLDMMKQRMGQGMQTPAAEPTPEATPEAAPGQAQPPCQMHGK